MMMNYNPEELMASIWVRLIALFLFLFIFFMPFYFHPFYEYLYSGKWFLPLVCTCFIAWLLFRSGESQHEN